MKQIYTEVLAIGDELVTGSIINTNSAYIAEKCEIIGLNVTRHSCFGDDLATLSAAILEASKRSKIIIVTGGLGPTFDDLTRDAAAAAAGVKLRTFPEALVTIEAFFQKLSRPMPESNKRQACFPENSEILDNPIGTAPGFMLKIGGAQFFFVPGVPREMCKMLDEQVMPRIMAVYKDILPTTMVRTINTFGISEALLGEKLDKLFNCRDATSCVSSPIKFGTRAAFPIIQVKIYVRGSDKAAAMEMLKNATKSIDEQLKDWIISYDNVSIEEIISKLLRTKKKNLVVIENGSGGLLTEWLNKVPISCDFFAKAEVFAPIKPFSAEITAQLAEQSLQQSAASYSLAVSGVLGQEEADRLGLPIGTLFIAIADSNQVEKYEFRTPFGEREQQKQLFAMTALDLLRRKLLGLKPLTEVFGKNIVGHKSKKL
jgi:nicotinamide-nucleotide amidase